MTEAVRPESTAAISGAAPTGAESRNQPPAKEKAPGPIPYDRFKEVNEAKNALQGEVERLRGQIQQVSQQNQQLVTWGQRIVEQQQSRPAPEPSHNNNTPAFDPEEIALQKLLGEDDAGKEARKVLDVHAEVLAKKKGYVSRGEMEKLLAEVAAQTEARVMGQLNTTFATTNRFSKWVSSGMISAQEGVQLQKQLNQIIQQNPQIKTQPHNVDYVASHLLATAVENGTIRPYSQPAPVNPLQPSGGGYAPAAPDPTEPINPETSGFRTLKGLSVERLRELGDKSIKAHKGATS